jgi:hypothetical protein
MQIDEKRSQAETALNDALNVSLEATVILRPVPEGRGAKEVAKEADAITTVSPGQEFLVRVGFHNGSKERLFLEGLKLEVPEGWTTISEKTRRLAIKPGDDLSVVFRFRLRRCGRTWSIRRPARW